MDKRGLVLAMLVGAVIGWAAAGLWPERTRGAAPSAWLAKVGDSYITEAMFVDEMRRRGGRSPGQYQDLVQKRALLDEMVMKQALVAAAEKEKLPDEPDVRRLLDQIIGNQYLQRTLRKTQEKLTVNDAEVRAHYDAHAADYVVPARRRVAMLQILVPSDASAEVWKNASERAKEALEKARRLGPSVPNFGVVAREYSQDQASRYRGGMIGWISDANLDRYRYDPVVLHAAIALKQAGEFSEVLRGKDGVYVVRVVEIEAQRERQFEQLATGIRQRLMQDKLQQAENEFRDALLKRSAVSIREAGLERIDPLAPPAEETPPQPPAMPAQ